MRLYKNTGIPDFQFEPDFNSDASSSDLLFSQSFLFLCCCVRTTSESAMLLFCMLDCTRFRITGDPTAFFKFFVFFFFSFPFCFYSSFFFRLSCAQGSISLYITVTAPFSTRWPTRQHTRNREHEPSQKTFLTCKLSLSCRQFPSASHDQTQTGAKIKNK